MEPIDSNNPPDAGTPAPPIPAFVAAKPATGRAGLVWHSRVPTSINLRYGMTVQGLVDRIVALENYGYVVLEPHKSLWSRLVRAWRMGGA